MKTASVRSLAISVIFLMMGGLIPWNVYAEKNTNSPIQTETPDRCAIVPKEGNCKGFFHVYYFGAQAGKCKEIIGCYDAVFDSMEQCSNRCEKAAGANPTEVSSSEALFLYLGQGGGEAEAIKGFIARGADIHYRDQRYRATPLHNAAHHGKIAAVKVLLDHGADVNAKNIEGNTPLYAAVHQRRATAAARLIRNGADVNAKNKFGYTPLRAACRNGDTGLVSLLLSSGADVNLKDSKGDTPLHGAMDKGELDVASLLINKGADINAEGSFGDRPIHVATSYGAAAGVVLLIQKGADLNLKNAKGYTPLDLAQKRGFKEIVDILSNSGGAGS